MGKRWLAEYQEKTEPREVKEDQSRFLEDFQFAAKQLHKHTFRKVS